MNVRGGKGFACKFGYLITEFVMVSRDEAALLAFQCVAYGEGGIVAIAVGREVWGLLAIA